MEVTDKLLTDVEELLIASESDQGAIAKLLDMVAGIEGDLPVELKVLFTDNIEMLISNALACLAADFAKVEDALQRFSALVSDSETTKITDSAEVAPGDAAAAVVRRVLLVDDSASNRAVGMRILQQASCTVDLAEDGLQAVEAVRQQNYDFVLMDCEMPGLNGLQATRRIRQLEGERRHTPIFAVTAHTDGDMKHRCMRAGMDDFLSNPLRRAELDAVIAGCPVMAVSEQELDDLLDANIIREVYGNDVDMIGQLLEIVETELPDRIVDLGAAVSAGNWSAASHLAHRIKGTVGNIGGKRLHTVVVGVEAAIAVADQGGCQRGVSGLAECYTDTIRVFRSTFLDV